MEEGVGVNLDPGSRIDMISRSSQGIGTLSHLEYLCQSQAEGIPPGLWWLLPGIVEVSKIVEVCLLLWMWCLQWWWQGYGCHENWYQGCREKIDVHNIFVNKELR